MYIETIRKERGLTKAALANKIGVRSQNLNKLLKNPTVETLQRVADALGVAPWQLIANPEDIRANLSGDNTRGTTDFAALIHFDGVSYTPHNVEELARLADELKAKAIE